MQKDAQRLQQLIQEILELSRGSATNSLCGTRNYFRKIYYRNSQLLSATIGSKTAENSRSWSAREPVFHQIELFYPIVKNLIENAIQYSKKMDRLLFLMLLKNQQLRLSVQDTGIGISQKDQERIFERFYRVDKARSVILVAPV